MTSLQIPVRPVGAHGFGGFLKTYHNSALEAFADDVESCFDLSTRELRSHVTISALCKVFEHYFPELQGKSNFNLTVNVHGSCEVIHLNVSIDNAGRTLGCRPLIALARSINKPELSKQKTVAQLAWTVTMRAAGINYAQSYHQPLVASKTPMIFDPISLAYLAGHSGALKLASTQHLKERLCERDVVMKLAATNILAQLQNEKSLEKQLYRQDTCRFHLYYKINDDLTVEGSKIRLRLAGPYPEASVAGLKKKRLCKVIELPGLCAFDVKVKSAKIEKIGGDASDKPYILFLETNSDAPQHQYAVDLRAHIPN